jgi:hypothetical protein
MTIADALLNSFFFYPVILAAGALASDDDTANNIIDSKGEIGFVLPKPII